ncbi:hypothetical protein G6F50_018513 [Rhizopus delemar]|uniref:Uncharacterized protein n=1 Tax=Rhizopus delemar TaxID=936053 RepID=A0A9P6XM02_9FUNG|nr:hypothetical protein G6F50_018513 [Rhizopus delemar]
MISAPRGKSGMVSNSGTTIRPTSAAMSWPAGAIRPASFCSTIPSNRSLRVSVCDTMVWRTACLPYRARPAAAARSTASSRVVSSL